MIKNYSNLIFIIVIVAVWSGLGFVFWGDNNAGVLLAQARENFVPKLIAVSQGELIEELTFETDCLIPRVDDPLWGRKGCFSAIFLSLLFQYLQGSLGLFLLIFAALSIGLWVFVGYCATRIGRKLNVSGAWMAYVPIANIFYFIKCAGKSYWWALLAFLPTIVTPLSFFVGGTYATASSIVSSGMFAVFYVFLWLAILSRLNMSKWVLLLIIFPFTGLFTIIYLAFSKAKNIDFGAGGGAANQQLVDYINQQLSAGVDKEIIKQSLLSAGWAEQDVEDAFNPMGASIPSGQNHTVFGIIVIGVLVAIGALAYYFAPSLSGGQQQQINIVFPSPSVSSTPILTPSQTPALTITPTPKPKSKSSPSDSSYATFIQGLVAQGWKKATYKPAPSDDGAPFSFYYPSNFKGQNTVPASPRDSIDTIDNPVNGESNGMYYTSYDSVAGFHSESSSAYSQETAFDAEIKFVTKFAEGSPVITDFATVSGLSGKKVIVPSSFGKPTPSEYIILHTGRNSSYGDEIAIRVDVSMNYVDIAEQIAKSISLL